MPTAKRNKPTINQFLTIKDAAERLHVSTKTLRRWEASGKFLPQRTEGGHRRYSIADIKNFKTSKSSRKAITPPITPVIREEAYLTNTLLEESPYKNNYQENRSVEEVKPETILPKPSETDKPQTPELYSRLHADQKKFITHFGAAVFVILLLLVSSRLTPYFAQSDLGKILAVSQNTVDSSEEAQIVENIRVPQVLQAQTEAGTSSFAINIDSFFRANADVAGTLNLTGNTLTSSADLAINPGGNVLLGSNLIVNDTFNIKVGGLTSGAYNSLANSDEAPEDAAIESDNDLYIGGDLEVDGVLVIGTDTVSDITGTGLQVVNNTLETVLGTEISTGEITDDTILEADLSVSNDATDGYALTYDSTTGGFTWTDLTATNTPSGFTDGGTLITLTTTTDNVNIGGSSELGKFAIDGDTDEIQFLVQGNGTQTSYLAVFEQSDGTDLLTLSNDGTLTLSDGANEGLLDLSNITQASSNPQGFKLPQGATLTNISGGGAGYLAYDTSAGLVKFFNGTSWTSISGSSSTLQQAYAAGRTIDTTSVVGDLAFDLQTANFTIQVGEGSDTGDFQISDGTDNWFFIDESADTLSLGAAAGSGIFITGADSSLVNLSAVNVSNGSEGILLPQTTDCSNGVSEGQVCWDTDTDALYIGNGSSATLIGGNGAGDITAVGDVTTDAAFTETTGNDGNSLWFEGTTADSNEIQLTAADPGSDITVTIPAIDGTLASLAGTQTFTGTKTFNDITIADTNVSFTGASTTFTTTGALSINTGGTITVGDGGDNIVIDSGDWDITSTGAITGATYEGLTITTTTGTFTLTDGKTLAVSNSLTFAGTDSDTWTFPAADSASGTVVGLTETQTLTNKTLTSPKIGTAILDTNGNELINLTATASAVNELTLGNAALGSSPTWTLSGTDTNIGLTTILKGTGSALFSATTANSDSIAIKPQTTATANSFTGTITSEDLTASRTWTFQDSDGTIALTSTTDNYQYWGLNVDSAGSDHILTTEDLNVNAGSGVSLGYVASTNTLTISATGTGGDITAVGDCTTGACFTSGSASAAGGTTLYFYDSDGLGQLAIADLSGATTWTLPAVTGTLASLAGTQTFTGAKTFDDITIADTTIALSGATTTLVDPNTNNYITFSPTTSAVNYLTYTNAATGTSPTWTLTSATDSNIGLTTALKGTGSALFSSTTASTDSIAIKPQTTTATGSFTGTLTSANLTAARTWTFQDGDGTVAFTSDIPTSDNYNYWVLSDGSNTTNITTTATATFTGGTGISATNSSGTIDFSVDATELNDLTWGDNSDSSIVWSFDQSGATDPSLTFTNSTITFGGDLVATPSDAAALTIQQYGTGAGQTGELRFMEGAASSTQYVGFKAPDSLTTSAVYTLPDHDTSAPTSNYVLTWQTGNVLQWKDVNGVGGTSGSGTENYLPRWDNTGTNLVDSGVSDDGSTLAIAGTRNLSVTNVNAASGSANAVALSGTLGIFDGSDTFRGLYVNYTNADHTGSSNSFYGIDIAGITGDAQATEYALNIGSGWDSGVYTASNITVADTALLDLSAITQSSGVNEGFVLPVLADTANKPASGSGYIAYNTEGGANKPYYYDGTNWVDFSGSSTTLQEAYNAGQTISVTSGNGDLAITGTSANVNYIIGSGTDTGDFRVWDGTSNWIFVDESADTLSIGAAAGSGITFGGSGITTSFSGVFSASDSSLVNLSSITQSSGTDEGFILPILADTANKPSTGSGYIAYNTEGGANKPYYYDGTNWVDFSGSSTTLQEAYNAGETISVTSGEGALSITGTSANVDFAIGSGTDTGDFRVWDGTSNWIFVDESADTLSIGAAAGNGISIGGSGITTTATGTLAVADGSILNLSGITQSNGIDEGFKLPTLTDTANKPATGGFIAYNTQGGANAPYYYNGSDWIDFSGASTTLQQAYANDVDGSDVTLELSAADGSIVFSNADDADLTTSAYVIEISNAATSLTTSNFKNVYNTLTGSFDTTSGDLTNYGSYITNTSTESGGGNTLTNVGLYATASGADTNYAAIFDAGTVQFNDNTVLGNASSDTVTLTGSIASDVNFLDASTGSSYTISGSDATGAGNAGGDLSISAGDGSTTGAGGNLILIGGTSASGTAGYISFQTGGAEKLRIENDGDLLFEKGSNDLTIQITAPSGASRTATIPALASNDTFCFASLANCTGAGGGAGVTYTGQTENYLTKFTANPGEITISTISDDGSTVTIDADKNFALADGTGVITQSYSPAGTTSSATAFTISPTFGIDTTDQTLTGILISPDTASNTDAGDTLYGINIDNITGSSATESALRLGSGYDSFITLELGSNDLTITADAPTSGSWSINIPSVSSDADFCLTTGNCSGVGGGVTASGAANNQIAVFSGAQTITSSSALGWDRTNQRLTVTGATGETTGTVGTISSSADGLTSGKLLSTALTSSTASASFTGDIAAISSSRTNATAAQTLTDTGNVLDLSRTTITNDAAATTNVTGAILGITNTATQTSGTLADSANLISITQDADATGALIYGNVNRSSTGTALLIEQSAGGTDVLSLLDNGDLAINGDLTVTGNDIKDSSSTTRITLGATTTLTNTTTTLSGTTTVNATSATAVNLGAATIDFNGAGIIQYGDGSNFTIRDDGSHNILALNGTTNALSFGNATDNNTFNFLGTGLVTITGSADGTNALTLTQGDIEITDGDLDVIAGDFNVGLDAADSANITNAGSTGTAGALVVSNTTTSASVGDATGASVALTLTNYADDGAADTRVGLDVTVTNNASDVGTDDNIYGLRVNDLGGGNNADGTEYGIYQAGTNWDYGLYITDSSLLYGSLQLGADGQDGQLILYNDAASGGDWTTTFNLSDSQDANITYTLPEDDGTADNQVLTTNGSGVLHWESVSGVGGINGSGTDKQIAFFNGTSSLTSESSGFGWDYTNNLFTVGSLGTETTSTLATLTSAANTITSGGLLSAALTSDSSTADFSGSVASISSTRDNDAAAPRTDSGKVLNLTRTTTTNNASATTNVTGAILGITNAATATLGTINDSANLISITQDADATGALLYGNTNRSSTGTALLIEQSAGGTDVLSLLDNGDLAINGDLTVTGNDIKDSSSTTRIALGSTTTLTNSTTTLSGTSTITASSLSTFTTSATLSMAATSTLNCADCIDFDDIKDALTLDAATTIASTVSGTSLDLNHTPAGTASAPIGLEITPSFGIDATDQTLIALNINANTNSNTDSGDTLRAINIDNITGTAATESAIVVGTGWDTGLVVAGVTVVNGDASTIGFWNRSASTLSPSNTGDDIKLPDSDFIAFGTGNDLEITHNGTNSVITSTTGNLLFDNTNVTGSSLFDLGTDTSATNFQVRNNSGLALLGVNGAGAVQLGSDGIDGKLILFSERGATDYQVSLTPSPTQTEDTDYVLPANLPNADNYVLTSTTGGTLEWKIVTGVGGVAGSGGDKQVAYFNPDANTLASDSNFTWDYDTQEFGLAGKTAATTETLTTLSSDSNTITSGGLLSAALTSSSISSAFTGDVASISSNRTSATAGTRTDTGNVLDLSRTSSRTNGTYSVTGAILNVTNSTSSSITDSANLIALSQDADATGALLYGATNRSSTGTALLFEQTAGGTDILSLLDNGNLAILGDLTVTGNDITFGSGAVLNQPSDNNVKLTENTLPLNINFNDGTGSSNIITIAAGDSSTDASLYLTSSGPSNDRDISLTSDDAIYLTPNSVTGDTGTIQANLGGTKSRFVFEATSSDITQTNGLLDINADAGNVDGVTGINLDFEQADGATTGRDAIAEQITLTQSDADGDLFGLQVINANVTSSGTTDDLITLSNNDTSAADGGLVDNAIKITSLGAGITTGININDTDVATAILLQQGEYINNLTDNQINLGIGTSGTLLLTSGTTASITNSAGILTINAQATSLDLQADGSINVNLAGGSSATGCTIANSTGNLTCSGTVTGSNGTFASTLQDAYNNDTDTGNTIIALTSADDSLIFRNPASSGTDSSYLAFIDQLDTTGVSALDIATASTDTDAVNITANSLTTQNIVDISGTGLTSGSGINVTGSGATLATGGELVNLALGANTVGSGLTITSTGAYTGTGAADGLINVTANSLTSGYGSQYIFNALTSGTGIAVSSTSAITTGGELLSLSGTGITTGRLSDTASTSNAITSGNLSNTSLTSSALTASFTGDVAKISSNRTHSVGGIFTDTGNVLDLSRTSEITGSGTYFIQGPILNITNTTTDSGGAITDTANLVAITQDADASGAALYINNAGTGADIAFNTTPTLTVGNGGTLTVTDGTNTLFSISDDTSEGDVTVTGDLAINGATSADITSTTATASIFNSTPTTVNIGGAATTINQGPTGSGASSQLFSGGSGDTGCTLDGSNGNWTCSGTISGSNGSLASNLQDAYDNDGGTNDNAIIALTSDNDSLIFRNPSSSGTDSAYLAFIDQLDTTGVSALDISTASTDTNAVSILADSLTGANAVNISADALTSGKGISLSTSSNTITSGGLLSLSLSSSSATDSFTGNVVNESYSRFNSTASQTLTDSGNLVNLSRSTLTNNATATTNVTGNILRVINTDTALSGTINDASSLVSITQDADATGALLYLETNRTDGAPYDILIKQAAAGLTTFSVQSDGDVALLGNAYIFGGQINLGSTSTITESSDYDLDIASNNITLNMDFGEATADTLTLATSTGKSLTLFGSDTTTVEGANGLALATTNTGDITLTPAGNTDLANVLTGNLKVGDGTPDVTLDGEDAYIEGTLEVDGTTQFDGNVTVTDGNLLDLSGIDAASTSSVGLRLPQGTTLTTTGPSGASNDGYLAYDVTNHVPKYWYNGAWTDFSGASTTLDQAYGNDIDAGDTTITLTTADDSLIFTNPTSSGTDSAFLLELNQANTTAGVSALDIIQASNAADAVNITADSIDTENAVDISVAAITTGTGINITGSGATMTTGGKLINLDLGANTVGSGLTITSTGAYTGTGASDGLINVIADSLTTGYGSQYSFDGLTTGTGINVTSSGTIATGGELLSLAGTGITSGRLLDITANADTLTTGQLANISSTATSITGTSTTGSLLNVTETGALTSSFVGNLDYFGWEPGSSATAYGNLLTVNIGANGTLTGDLFQVQDGGSDLFRVNESIITSSLTHEFTAAGDVAVAYDLQFTNQTSSTIKSNAPLLIQAGEPFESDSLTLAVYNSGSVIVDAATDLNTSTNGAFNLNVQSATNNNIGLYESYVVDSTVASGTSHYGAFINLVHNSNEATANLYGLTVQSAATTNATTGSYDCLLCLTNAENSAGAVTDALRISSTSGTNTDITTAINISSTNVVTDIALQNAETIDNNTDGTVIIKDSDTTTLISASKTALQVNLDDTNTYTETLCHSGADDATGVVNVGDCNAAGGGDLAEFYGSDGTLTAGDIVEIDSAKPTTTSVDPRLGHTIKSFVTRAIGTASTNTIGIISTNPSIYSMGKGAYADTDYAVPVAMTGRAPVKISDLSDPIVSGDYITVSSEAGKGQKATAPGYVVGRSLEAWTAGTGQDSVVVLIENDYVDPAASGSTTDTLTTRVDSLETQVAVLESQLSLITGGSTPDDITTNKLTVNDTLVSLGSTILSDTSVTGKLDIGAIEIDSAESSIDTVGTLKIQPLALGDIEFFGGLITFDTQGNATVQEITAKKYNVEGESSGTSIIAAGSTSVFVPTSAVTADSLVFTNPKSPIYFPLSVTSKVDGSGFTVEMFQPETSDISFDWWIVDKVAGN